MVAHLTAYARKDILLLSSLYSIPLSSWPFCVAYTSDSSKPHLQDVIRMADALIVSEARHKTLAGLYRLLVDPPDASNGADSLRISPWTADDLRAPLRRFTVADLVTHATKTNAWTLSVSLDDSLGAKDKGTRHLEAVEYHHDHNQSQGKKNPRYTNGTVHVEVRL